MINETERLLALKKYRVFESNTKPFNEITQIASQLFKMPSAMITIVDDKNIWFKSLSGKNSDFSCPRELSFSYYAVKDNTPLYIEDLRTDHRFKNFPLVTTIEKFVFYAGVPLKTPCGHNIGTLSICDTKPRSLTPEEIKSLELLAKQVTNQLELQRHKSICQEQAKMTTLASMTAGVAHEINNPLTIIFGKVQILRQMARDNELSPDSVLDFSEKIENTVKRISDIVKGLNLYSRNGSQDEMKKVRVTDLIQDTLIFCENRFKRENIQFIMNDIDESLVIECRHIQICQVLLNILNNAYDAVLDQPEPWIKLYLEEFSEKVQFIIEDSGPGIPDLIKDKIMQPFFTTKENGKGTGLGLSLSNSIVESHRGKLFLEEDSQHTKFIIEIPKKHLQH